MLDPWGWLDIGFEGADHLSMIGIVSPGRMGVTWLCAWGLWCLIGLPLEAGVVMNLRTTDYSQPEPRVEATRMVIEAGLLKMDIESPVGESSPKGAGDKPPAAGRDQTLVFRGGEQSSITVIDHHKKSFSVIDRESMAAFSTEMQILMQATSTRIESLPPEQRAIVQKMIESQIGKARQPNPNPSTVLKTHERDTLSGLPCVKYEVFLRGEKLREVWVTSPESVQGGESALAILQEMSDFYSTLMDSVDRTIPGLGGGFRVDQNPFEDLGRMNGFPVLTRNFADGRVRTEIVLHSVGEQSLSPAELEPPEGYTARGLRDR